MEVSYSQSFEDEQLHQILQLQRDNLPQNISEEEAVKQGFVTVEHDFDLLKRMNQPHPHIVAISEEQVIAYALVMLRDFEQDIPVLVPMLEEINKTVYQDTMLGDASYVVMGQVCVGKDFRGKGVFSGLYHKMKESMAPYFSYLITEIDVRNTRSVRAHAKVGFETIKTYSSPDGRKWDLVLLELT